MAVGLNKTSIFTVKYVDEKGTWSFKDYSAIGVSDAEEQFKFEFPELQITSIWRKQ